MKMSLRRLAGLCSTAIFLLAALLCRVYWISTDTAYAASAGGQSSSDTALPTRRGDFYDRAGRKLTGVVQQWYALCIPGDSSYARLFPYVPFAAQTELYEKRNSMSPFLVEVDRNLSSEGVYTYRSEARYLANPIARHLIGYLDGDGYGVSGLERAYEDVLAAAGDVQAVSCTTTAQGALLTGTEPTLQTTRDGTGQGVVLTLDANLQRACEGLAQRYIGAGCIVVMDVGTGEVLASVSMPEFDPDNLAKSIEADDTSFINRPLSAFSAGSVFKVVLATAAYIAGLDWFSYTCEGSVEVADQVFRCAQGKAHGEVNLRGALEQSCNCYFIKLGQLLGGGRILETAQSYGFGSAAAIASGMKSAAGTLPDRAALENAGQLAMFSFGQGVLTATPLQITAMMNAVASKGQYRPPSVVRGVADAETLTLTEPFATPEPTEVCSEEIAAVLRSMLVSVVEEGIGREAVPDEGGAGGKTGTAQTGQYDAAGSELLNHWFTGFWPAEEPRYTITVLQDGIREPETGSAKIFAEVANALYVLEMT